MSKKHKDKKHKEQASQAEIAKEEAIEPVVEPVEPTVEQQLAELQMKYQRLAADYQNYQKRAHKEIRQAGEFSRENLTRSLLPILDNFEHALEKGSEAQDAETVVQGVKIVYDHFMDTLLGAGIKPIEVEVGCPFDPTLHEALMQEENDQMDANCVVRELARGYIMNDRTLRPAKVSVAKAPAEPQEQETETEQEPTEDNS